MENKRKLFFVAIILFILTGLFITSSCVTGRAYRRILKDCPSANITSDSISFSTDTTRKETVTIDTAYIPIEVPGPIQYLPHPCASLCDSFGHLKPFDKTAHKNGISLHTFTRNDSLVDECKEDSLMREIEKRNMIIEINNISHEEKVKTLISNQSVETWWQILYRYGFWIMLPLIIVYSGYKFLGFISWLKRFFP